MLLKRDYSHILQKGLKRGTVSGVLCQFVLLNRFDLGPIWTGENGFANFFVFVKIFAKNVCQWLCRHCVSGHMKLFYFWKSNKLTKKYQKCSLIFSKIAFSRSCSLRRHGVDVVNESMTMQTIFENFLGFSQILKEQLGEKSYFYVFTNPIAII